VVLYFYPKDETPGCTREACDFRDRLVKLRSVGAEVLGVSKDSLDSHHGFIRNHRLGFPLLSDADNRVARAYGAYVEKVLYGRRLMGTIRSTFLIDPQGRIEAVWSPVKVDGHADAVLARLSGREAPGNPPARPTRRPGKKRPPRAAAPRKRNAGGGSSSRPKAARRRPAKGRLAKGRSVTGRTIRGRSARGRSAGRGVRSARTGSKPRSPRRRRG
jgi:peroxiredoxin Q/BCP